MSGVLNVQTCSQAHAVYCATLDEGGTHHGALTSQDTSLTSQGSAPAAKGTAPAPRSGLHSSWSGLRMGKGAGVGRCERVWELWEQMPTCARSGWQAWGLGMGSGHTQGTPGNLQATSWQPGCSCCLSP